MTSRQAATSSNQGCPPGFGFRFVIEVTLVRRLSQPLSILAFRNAQLF